VPAEDSVCATSFIINEDGIPQELSGINKDWNADGSALKSLL